MVGSAFLVRTVRGEFSKLGRVFRVIGLIDMDAFFAAVEQRDNPGLRGKPVIVGSPPTQRGVVCAASYEARKFGVRSAMPSVIAGRLCPSGIFVRPRMERYREESRLVMGMVAESGAIIEQVSVDEVMLREAQCIAIGIFEPGDFGTAWRCPLTPRCTSRYFSLLSAMRAR